jgi:excisionase family DNA binding protein
MARTPPSTTSAPTRWMNRADLATYLRCSLRTVDELKADGAIYAYRVRRLILFDLEEVDEMVRSSGGLREGVVMSDDVIIPKTLERRRRADDQAEAIRNAMIAFTEARNELIAAAYRDGGDDVGDACRSNEVRARS